MWQITLSVDGEKREYLNRLEHNLSRAAAKASAVTAVAGKGGRTYFSAACEGADGEGFLKKLCDGVTELIIEEFKYDYIAANSKLVLHNKIGYKAFMCALVAFDRGVDRDIIKKRLRLKNGLNLDGFYNFRLKELRARWAEICRLADDNAEYLTYPESRLELLRFLIGAADSKADEVTVERAGDAYFIRDSKSGEQLKTAADGEGVLSALINIAPRKIRLNGVELENGARDMLYGIFGGKVAYK